MNKVKHNITLRVFILDNSQLLTHQIVTHFFSNWLHYIHFYVGICRLTGSGGHLQLDVLHKVISCRYKHNHFFLRFSVKSFQWVVRNILLTDRHKHRIKRANIDTSLMFKIALYKTISL